MKRKPLCVACACVAIFVMTAFVVVFLCRDYESTSELMFGDKVNGRVRYAFENGHGDRAMWERLGRMQENWLSSDFRSRVYRRVCATRQNLSSNELLNALSATTVEIRRQKVSVLIRSRASSSLLAALCAQAYSQEIVDVTAEQGRSHKERGIAQLKRNCMKHERHVNALQEKLRRLKGTMNVEPHQVENVQRELVSQRKALAGLKSDLVEMQNEDCWCGFFVAPEKVPEEGFLP